MKKELKITEVHQYTADTGAILQVYLNSGACCEILLDSKANEPYFCDVVKGKCGKPETDGKRVFWSNGAALTLREVKALLLKKRTVTENGRAKREKTEIVECDIYVDYSTVVDSETIFDVGFIVKLNNGADFSFFLDALTENDPQIKNIEKAKSIDLATDGKRVYFGNGTTMTLKQMLSIIQRGQTEQPI